MRLYLVRHGESKHNLDGVHQNNQSVLSITGIKQSEILADRLSRIEASIILASPFERTRQTAEIIGEKIKKGIEYNDLFVEIKRPTEIELKLHDDQNVINIRRQIKEHYSDSNWRYSDEETFFDFRTRTIKAIKYLTDLNQESIILITHGALTKMMICVMAYGEEVDPNTYLKLRNLLHDHNTGITICEYEDEKWKLLTWNDYAHLG